VSAAGRLIEEKYVSIAINDRNWRSHSAGGIKVEERDGKKPRVEC
jgi:hypothetical protein